MELTWHKDAKPSTYYATHNGKRIATAYKEATGGAWIGSVVGLGFTFGGRRLMDVKGLALVHVERIYGDDVWTLFPARDLRPGMVLGCDTWRGEEREIISVNVDPTTQVVEVKAESESSRELGINLDTTYRIGEYVRVKVQEETPTRAEDLAEGDVIRLYDCDVRVTGVDCDPAPSVVETVVLFVRVSGEYVGMTGRKVWSKAARLDVVTAKGPEGSPAVQTLDDPASSQALAECEADQREKSRAIEVEDAPEMEAQSLTQQNESLAPPCGLRRLDWERPGSDARRLPCTLPTGHTQPHRDAFGRSFTRSEADASEGRTTTPVAPEVGQVIDLHPFTAIVDGIAGTGVLISPPASEDLSASAGGASLHDALLADVMRRLALLGVEALEGEDGGLSLEGVTAERRQVFSLYLSDAITTEPDFEEVACSIEALRHAAGL
ncbi:hypothetical protein ACIQY8_25710 [Streptomyces albidoflavus]